MKIKLTKRAERRIQIVDQYWREHRLEAPDLLKQELNSARLRLAQDPYAGTAVVLGGKQLRKLLLPRTEQWLYYAIRPRLQLIVVQNRLCGRRVRTLSRAFMGLRKAARIPRARRRVDARRRHGRPGRDRPACATGKAEAKEQGHELERGAKRTLREERIFQRQMRRAGKKPPERSTALERSQEDDDAVRNNLPAELIPVFDKHRRSFKGSPRRSRTEHFLEWAEENPDEVLAVQQAEADEALKALLREERTLAHSARRIRHPKAKSDRLARGLESVPF